MNPEFLEADELDYEMSIRKVYLDTRRRKTAALVKFLAEERDGLRATPHLTGLDPEEEIVTCGVKLDLLKLGLEVVNHKDESELNRCYTKFIHIQSRARRIVPPNISVRMHETLMSGIQEVDTQLRDLGNRNTQSTKKTAQSLIVPITTSSYTESSNQEGNLMYTRESNPIDLMSGDTSFINNQASGFNTEAISSFDPSIGSRSKNGGLPPPILPSTPPFRNLPSTVDESDTNKRFERLETMLQQVLVSMSENRISGTESRSQQDHLRGIPGDYDRTLGAIPKTNKVTSRPGIPTWSLPTETTTPVVQTQRDLYQNSYPRTNRSHVNHNPLNGENQVFGIPPQSQYRARQQTPYYYNEQQTCDPRCSQYNHQTPLVNSSFINDNASNHQNNFSQRSNNGQNSFQGGRKSIPVHKWRISFDGENDLNDFLSKVEMYAKFESTPDDVLMSSVGYLFSKRALSWYRVHYKEYERWADLRSALIEEFLPSHSDFQITNQINNRFQSKNESFGEYLSAVQILFSYMSEPPNLSHQLQLIRRNMDPTYMFALSAHEIVSVKQLAQICRRLDDTKDMIQMRSKSSSNLSSNPNSFQGKRVQFSELSEPLIDCDLEVAAFTTQRRNDKVTPNEQFARRTPPVIACWNCLKSGHTFNYCPEEQMRLFCYTCGMHNTSRPKCPKCSPGNQRPGSQSPK